MKSDLIKEALHWVEQNKGTKCGGCGGCYSSPRVSSELPDCSLPMTFDQYNYCSLGCLYCFAYFFKTNNPAINKVELKAVDPEAFTLMLLGKSQLNAGKLFHKHFFSKRFVLHWGGLADPFCSFEAANGVGLKIIHALGRTKYPTLFSFKGNTIFQPSYVKEFERWAHQQNFAFQISMVTGSDTVGREVEIGVPLPSVRLKAIKMLSDMGYWTVLRLRPFIIGITDEGLDDLLERALAAGIKGISAEFMAIDGRANKGMKTRYEYLSKLIGVDNLIRHFGDLSPKERGGYMRLNRLVKEPYVQKLYTFCKKHGLVLGISDPDFKELNTSGSCCAMPDKFPANPEMTNWSRSQLTYHLKEAQRVWVKTGQKVRLHFMDVYKDSVSYLDDPDLANDHVRVIGMCCSDRKALTLRVLLQEGWNNLNSPANPRNYFHGKLMPCGTDAEGNLVYEYNPMEYEQRWKAGGIL